MSPHRRNSQESSSAGTSNSSSSNNNNQGQDNNNGQQNDMAFDKENGPWPCSLPKGCLFSNGSNLEHIKIASEDLSDAVKVRCTNDQCPQSSFMHASCFETFEENALQHLRASGRSKSWTEKQRLQNLWTKRGYDLVYKACDCLCGHGHLKKDLDWTAPPSPDDQVQSYSETFKSDFTKISCPREVLLILKQLQEPNESERRARA